MDEWVTLATFASQPEAHVARGLLAENGIEAVLEGEQLLALYGTALGNLRLRVGAEDLERAAALLGLQRASTAPLPAMRCPECGSGRLGRDTPMRWLVFLTWFLVGLPLPFYRPRWRCAQCGHMWKSRWDGLPEFPEDGGEPERPQLRLEPRVLHSAVPPWDIRSEAFLVGGAVFALIFLTSSGSLFHTPATLAAVALALFALSAQLTRRSLRVTLRDSGLLLDGPDGEQEFPLRALDAAQEPDGRLVIRIGGFIQLQGLNSGRRDRDTIRLREEDLKALWTTIRGMKGQDARIWEKGAALCCVSCGAQFTSEAIRCSECGGALERAPRP